MQKLLLFAWVALLLSALPSTASPVLCSSVTDYAGLVALGSTGCQINDLVFSNFTFTGSATGTGLQPVASQLTFSLDNPGTSTGTGQQIWGFEFDPNLTVLGIGSEDIGLQYDITAPTAEITSIHLLETAAATGSAAAFVLEGPDCAAMTSGGGCTFLPTLLVTQNAPHQDLLGIGPDISLHVFKDINVTSNSATGFAAISNVRDAVDETGAAVPEPASLSYLLGAGFVLVGFVTRKRVTK